MSVSPTGLRERATVFRHWNGFELGMTPPEPINFWDTADLLNEAADEIERLRAECRDATAMLNEALARESMLRASQKG